MRPVRLDRDGATASTSRASTAPPEPEALADRVRRLAPSHRDPDAFHVEKSETERAFRRLAKRA